MNIAFLLKIEMVSFNLNRMIVPFPKLIASVVLSNMRKKGQSIFNEFSSALIRILSNHPRKLAGVEGFEIEVVDFVPIERREGSEHNVPDFKQHLTEV